MASASSVPGWRWRPERDALLAEAHARPYTPLAAPALVDRIASVSGEGGAGDDRAHMAALCRKLGQPEPGPDAKWCVLDAGTWRLRWERHTEFSTWTFFRPVARSALFTARALDLAPQDWLAGFPGEVLVAVRLEVRPAQDRERVADAFETGAIGALLADGAIEAATDFRPDALGFTRFLVLDAVDDPWVVGRLTQTLLEIETYRLMAMLAFPLAGEVGVELTRIERSAADLAGQMGREADPDHDRLLLERLAGLAVETEGLIGRTSFRFGAAAAYHELIRDRIERLRESRVEGRPTLGEFMQRRLDPAMRTCRAVADRQRAAIDRIARMAGLLDTRVQVAAEATNAQLLASMDRRAAAQLRLQQTVEGLSTAAISYYALGLLAYPLQSLERAWGGFDAGLAIGVLAPFVVLGVWALLNRWRRTLTGSG
jgi:uncharacterized membrane-anchored protein